MYKRKSIKQEGRFDFIPTSKWDKLSKEEQSLLKSYRGRWTHINKSKKEIEWCKDRIKILKDKIDKYHIEQMKVNKEIDYLRETYDFSVSIVVGNRVVNKSGVETKYYNMCISRRNHPTKNCGLGSEVKIINQLEEYYKGKRGVGRIKILIKKDWLEFLKKECKVGDKYYDIMDMILDNPKTFHNNTINLNTLFPISTK